MLSLRLPGFASIRRICGLPGAVPIDCAEKTTTFPFAVLAMASDAGVKFSTSRFTDWFRIIFASRFVHSVPGPLDEITDYLMRTDITEEEKQREAHEY